MGKISDGWEEKESRRAKAALEIELLFGNLARTSNYSLLSTFV